MGKLTYKKSGVNINEADKFVKFISKIRPKLNRQRSSNIGAFASITEIPNKFKKPVIVTSTDGVGTKIEIANKLKKFDTIGVDLVAMCVNDLIVQGAKPLAFLDYISINKINLKKLKHIVSGIVKGCKISGCELVGGETAEMPGTYELNKFDIAGFAVGAVEKKKILKKENVKKNNLILAIPSNGLHSNGYSLIRFLLESKKVNLKRNKFLKKELLKPTKIYVQEILKLTSKNLINSCANITGGGIEENIKRVIPNNLTAEIDLKKIKTQKIFKWLRRSISEKEMIKTFNCGVGFCIIIKPQNLNKVINIFKKEYKPYVIGKIISGNKKTKLYSKIQWI